MDLNLTNAVAATAGNIWWWMLGIAAIVGLIWWWSAASGRNRMGLGAHHEGGEPGGTPAGGDQPPEGSQAEPQNEQHQG